MNWNDNQELEPWEIPDRPLHPDENAPDTSAGAQWVRRQQQKRGRRPHRRAPAPAPNPRRDAFQSRITAAIRMTNITAVVYGVYGALLFLIAALFALLDASDSDLALETLEFAVGAGAAGGMSAGLMGWLSLAALLWLLLAAGLWRKNRAAALAGVILNGFAVAFAALSLSLTDEPLSALIVPLAVFAVAICGAVGAFRYQRLRRLVVAGEPLADRRPHAWLPDSPAGKCGLAALCLLFAGSLALFIAGASQLGSIAVLLSETAPVSQTAENLADGDGSPDAPLTGIDSPDPAQWEQTALPGTSLSLPLPSDLVLTEEDAYANFYYNGDNPAFAADVYWSFLGDVTYTKEEGLAAAESLLEGYGEYGDESVAVPLFSGETEDGILYAQVTVESESGYVYAVRSFLYGDVYGTASYSRYDMDGWSSAFDEAASSCFTRLKAS